MSDNIAGYIDRSIVKGQTYRYAGASVPTTFVGDINTITEDLLVKAMYVENNGQSTGDFPVAVGGRFLMDTIKYGNNTYLQIAYPLDSCIEYARIYSDGEWTKWATSNAGDLAAQINELRTDVDTIHTSENNNGLLDKLTSDVRKLDSQTDPKGRVTIVEQTVNSMNNTFTEKINNKIKQVVISQNITMGTSGEVNGKFQLGTELAYPTNGVLIGMRVNTAQIAAINGTVYMLCYASNGTKPYINYQKGSGVTFSNIPHDFIFTFYVQ